jgi:hypothetical protein
MNKDSISLLLMTLGIFLTSYNVASIAKVASLESKPTLTAQIQEK